MTIAVGVDLQLMEAVDGLVALDEPRSFSGPAVATRVTLGLFTAVSSFQMTVKCLL
jgi:hypothetical protein